ncbi:MAG: sulfotransferase [Euryarchaeota archaeon]|nr:sulfotransferase [Euryarchaeota archaeon]
MKNIENKDQQHIQLLENVKFQPVFILGLHRSGTSILYKMLNATGCFNPVTAYHLIRYDQLLTNHINNQEESSKKELTESFQEKGLDDRGIDKLKINADFAEEYGFLLGQKTLEMYITQKNLALFTEMAKKIQFISENKKPILLKNPYDLPNFLYIKQVFLNAKFVFIHRHPFKTLSSNIQAVEVLLKNKNPYTTQLFRLYNKIFENPLILMPVRLCFSRFKIFGVMFLTMNSSKATKYYLKNIKQLSKQDYISITYEELCENPQNNIEKIMKSLNIKIDKKIDFTSFIRPRKIDLDPSVLKLRKFIFKFMRKYAKCFGYAPEDVSNY